MVLGVEDGGHGDLAWTAGVLPVLCDLARKMRTTKVNPVVLGGFRRPDKQGGLEAE
ncbi:MAG: hypothetical protein M0008_00560 [Actinomycetota bacterium]|nr:hypothetical protein [Actinomycetota bacterium]